jgi:hypothetical protein
VLWSTSYCTTLSAVIVLLRLAFHVFKGLFFVVFFSNSFIHMFTRDVLVTTILFTFESIMTKKELRVSISVLKIKINNENPLISSY